MADGFNWTCPTCGRHTTITSPNRVGKSMTLVAQVTPIDEGIGVQATLIQCPNSECGAQSFTVRAFRTKHDNHHPTQPDIDYSRQVGIGKFTFLPTTAQPLSVTAPQHVKGDYNEAYLIKDLSPKASATLARRALQGMARDFFDLPKLRSLHDELQAIEDKCDPDLYAAMMAIKSVGNIGAHPERDVSLMVDVEPGEPQALLDLIHLLDQEWYVARAARAARVERMRALGQNKAAAIQRALPPAEAPKLLPDAGADEA